ncbi:MAG: hypothetical protein VE98_C0001G0473 [candidate division Kazan bacterium GW2011_GWA1_50_15]|uniref:Lipoprotein n=2 Tax=Bacteria division Kazan-3B-28 TaxID=1798534 RepID=A0A0G1ZGX3_UNCK3|nr:MAG: hypothetical protein VE98_C0001G0473 [candidate division Kazan bacterium GW2011_GWA1_50_15]KKW25839.1 MAG: hypothetical protein VE99_C0001G0478 [candidate division Kazan bacterium GW2011_GWC1_52_13]KKW27147.1 MAG: hypothetical protein VF00_C0001G0082 [candidate division Kazan bacterium GW2011_GWB1_52_7]HCR42435.1 hypothetical protein [Patescibacteria group bacterium]
MPKSIRQLGWLLLGAMIFLSACSSRSLSSGEVVQRFSTALADLHSFHYDASLSLSGGISTVLGQKLSSAQFRLTGDVMSPDITNPRVSLQASMQGTASQGDLTLAGQLIGLPDYTYFKLTDLNFPTLLPVSLGADSRWYRVKRPAPDASGNRLGASVGQQLTDEQVLAIHNMIASTTIFEVSQTFPDETVYGQRAYRYQAKLRPDNMRYLAAQVSAITGTSTGDLSLLDQLNNYTADIWINKRNFQLARIKIEDIYLANSVPVSFSLDLGLSRQNEKISIAAPNVAEELDSQNLLDQLGHWQPAM